MADFTATSPTIPLSSIGISSSFITENNDSFIEDLENISNSGLSNPPPSFSNIN